MHPLLTRVFIVERYHYTSTSQQLPKKLFSSLHFDVSSANAAASALFQQLLKEHFANLGYLEDSGSSNSTELFRGSFILKQGRVSEAVERVGIQVRREVREGSQQLHVAISSNKKRRRSEIDDGREKKILKNEHKYAVQRPMLIHRRGLMDGFSDVIMDEADHITGGQNSDLIMGIC